jgi:phosphatidate cytidylyltransferase
MLKYRILTIIVLLPLVWGLIFYMSLPWQRVALGGLMLLAWWEWVGLTPAASLLEKGLSLLSLLGLAVATHHPDVQSWLWGTGCLFWTLYVPLWFKRQWKLSPLLSLLIGSVLIASLFSAMSYLLHRSPYFLVAGMSLVWVSDSMAYIGGRLLGRHKLAPSISPGKTWEGFVVGTLSAAIYVAVSSVWIRQNHFPAYVLGGLAFILAIYGVGGDLFESLLKRQAGKKDSGSVLPGHGGILDRIDALFPVLPYLALLYPFFDAWF